MEALLVLMCAFLATQSLVGQTAAFPPERSALSCSFHSWTVKRRHRLRLRRGGLSGDAQFLQHGANLTEILGVWITVPAGQRGKWCKSC